MMTCARDSLALANMERRCDTTLFFCFIDDVFQAWLASIQDVSKESEQTTKAIIPQIRSSCLMAIGISPNRYTTAKTYFLPSAGAKW